MVSFASNVFKKWFGPFTWPEFKKYFSLGLIFAFIIGTYWALRPLKEAIFGTIVGGGKYLAIAKMVSMTLLFPVVTLYVRAVEKFERHKMFYVISAFYFVMLICWSIFFSLPDLGLSNTVASPWRISGWLWYVFVESFGSLVVALFWAFTTDISDPKSAKYGFPLVVIIGQLGGIIMPKYLAQIPVILGTTNAPLVGLCSIFTVFVALFVFLFLKITPKDQLVGFKGSIETKKKEKPKFLDGLSLLLKNKYLLGILFVVTSFEVIVEFISFNFKSEVIATFTTDVARNVYLSNWSSAVNTVTFLCLFFGINNLQRWLGVRFALTVTPVVLGAFVFIFRTYHCLDVLFWLVIGGKAIGYSLNGPTTKQLYVPTSYTVKYKAQPWIETFGSRGGKTLPSMLNVFKDSISSNIYLLIIFYMSFGILGLWTIVALFLGKSYNKALKTGDAVA
ncbi:hypothetical protein HN446_03525 [bacterium]|jgi:ATP:ADP antiporter, AAA family|nr:hypothetical protein [bacterium]